MGERDVDRIIEQWRAEARAAGESAPPRGERGPGRLRRLAARIGWLRLAGAVAAVCLFALVALPVLGGGGAPVAAGPDAAGDPTPARPETPTAEPGSAQEAAASPDPLPIELVDDWFGVVESVDAARAAAYATGDEGRLEVAFADDGPALVQERESVAALVAGGVRAVGWRTELLSVSRQRGSADTAELAVRDRRGSYDLVDASGAVTTVPAAEAAEWLISVRKSGEVWQVVEVSAQP